MNKNLQPGSQNKFRLRTAPKKPNVNLQEETAFDRARESALLMLAQLSLSKTVAQLKKQ
jgi:hypothetical protein